MSESSESHEIASQLKLQLFERQARTSATLFVFRNSHDFDKSTLLLNSSVERDRGVINVTINSFAGC